MPRKALPFMAGSVAVLSASTLLLPLVLNDGLATGKDVLLHVGNVAECAYMLGEGRLPPFDWLPDIAGGRGGPNYRYYGSLGFLGPSCFVVLGMEPEDAIRAWTGLVIAVGFLSAFLLGSTYGGTLAGLACGAMYIYGPYYHSLPYSRAGYPEHLAYSLYPLVFFLASRSIARKGQWNLAGCSVVLSFIVAVHTLSLAILVPCLVVFFVLTGRFSGRGFGFHKCLGMLILAGVLIAPSLVGPVLEREDIVLDEQLGSPEAAQSYVESGVPWYSMLHQGSRDDGISSRCVPGRVHIIAVLGALLLAARLRDAAARKSAFLHIALALGSLLLAERTAAGLCAAAFPSVAYLQFPWRFLGLFNLFASLAFATCVSKASPLPEGGRLLLAASIPVLCIPVYLARIPDQQLRGLPTRTREGIRASMTTLDHEDKYMPVGAKAFEEPAPEVLLDVPGGERFEMEVRPNDYRYSALARWAVEARFHQYFFDGWRAEVDGRPVPVGKDESGLCRIDLPQGSHEVRLHFERPPLHEAALAVSVAGWAALGIAAAISLGRRSLTRAG
jgi:hypothetical protein